MLPCMAGCLACPDLPSAVQPRNLAAEKPDILRLLDVHEGLKSEAEATAEAAAEKKAADQKAQRHSDVAKKLLHAAHSAMSGPLADLDTSISVHETKDNLSAPIHSVEISVDRSGSEGLRA